MLPLIYFINTAKEYPFTSTIHMHTKIICDQITLELVLLNESGLRQSQIQALQSCVVIVFFLFNKVKEYAF